MSLKYREKYRFGPFFSGKERGDCAYCELTDRLFCIFGDAVTVIDMKSGQKKDEISFEGDLVSCLQISKGRKFKFAIDYLQLFKMAVFW